MSKAFEMISESLNEIIDDLEKNDGKNLKREILTEEKTFESQKKIIHLTSDKDKKVAEKMNEISKMIFERNRKAYRILANK